MTQPTSRAPPGCGAAFRLVEGETALDVFATLADVSEDRGWQLALGLIAAWRAAGDVRRASAVTRRLSEAAKGDGSKVEQAVLGLTALGNMFIELYADCTGSPVDSVIRDAAALAYDDPPS